MNEGDLMSEERMIRSFDGTQLFTRKDEAEKQNTLRRKLFSAGCFCIYS